MSFLSKPTQDKLDNIIEKKNRERINCLYGFSFVVSYSMKIITLTCATKLKNRAKKRTVSGIIP